MSKSICLAIICKNESHCILDALKSVSKFINYWVICDTGSTDDTCEKIENYFRELKIPGEIYHDSWLNMGHNKSLMMSRAKGTADYIIHMDADDVFIGDLDISELDSAADSYFVSTKRGNTFYKVEVLFNGRHLWEFCGAAHTTIKNIDKPIYTSDTLSNSNFFLESKGHGARSFDPKKFVKDAETLKEQFFQTLLDDPDNLNARSAFYTGQSYFDAGDYNEAIKWSKLYQRLKDSWIEEDYECQLRIMKSKINLKRDNQEICKEADKAISILPDRAEAYQIIGKYMNDIRRNDLAYAYLSKAKQLSFDDASKKYKLFVDKTAYGKFINDDLSVACYWLEKYEEGYKLLLDIIDDLDFDEHKDRLIQNKIYFEQKMNLFTRADVINTLIKVSGAKKYLEIGVSDGENFKQIDCSLKLGVDPDINSEALIIQTSDEFFSNNKTTFDVIFIDGLHLKEQVTRDINNALKFLNQGGYIICHDINPLSEELQIEEFIPGRAWCGDTWKAFVETRALRQDLLIFTIDTDFGCGVIKKIETENDKEILSKIPSLSRIKEDIQFDYKFLEKHRIDLLGIISVDEFTNLFGY